MKSDFEVVRSALVLFLVLAAWSGGCSGEPPRQANSGSDVRTDDDVPEAQNAEWLYATKGMNIATLHNECEAVRGAMKNESECLGETCLYASRLGEDWIRRCGKSEPTNLDEVSALTREFNEKKKGQRVPCMREIESVLSKGCSETPNCSDFAQEWTTRCSGVVNSPLVVRILEVRVEQGAGANGVKLDKRNCKELGAGMVEATNCIQRFQCEDALPGADTYRKRCLAGTNLPGFREGMGELSIRIGSGQTPEAIPIAPDSPPMDAKDFALPLADNTGAIALVCGDRAADLQQYLAMRKECADGQILILQRQPGRVKSSIRVGRFQHPSDEAFAQNYPSLMVRGERVARVTGGLQRLSAELEAASQKATAMEATSALIKALEKDAASVRSTEDGAPNLRDQDAKLVILFRSIALAKVDTAKSLFKPAEYSGFIRRSVKRPLADVTSDGKVSVEATNGAAALDLEKVLPQAVTAYKNELAVFAERARKKLLPAKLVEAFSGEASAAASACVAAEGKVRESEGALLECGFGAACDAEVLADLQKELESGRKESVAARARMVLALASLDDGAEPPAQAARCEQPWW